MISIYFHFQNTVDPGCAHCFVINKDDSCKRSSKDLTKCVSTLGNEVCNKTSNDNGPCIYNGMLEFCYFVQTI